ncbi:MAG: bifunctional folylpolyglutamate synthase/dihydrofolate synthase, partial [Actinobacteria bacterium]|nr:bifunctional folylpolyglutamate synthase/dihydrofolate synthase [Actinomycetota bacterium]
GAYTSPHLERVNERITWNGGLIPDEDLAAILDLLAAIEPALGDRPTWFELVTAAALQWFADVAVDVAAVEVGVGGTWDATNVVDGRVAVVTNVSIDHVEYLGPTREEIAREKAGIVKPGATLVLGEPDEDLRAIFLEREPGRVIVRGDGFGVRDERLAHGGRLVHLFTPGGDYPDVYLPLHGAYQADNAAAALTAAEAFLDAPLHRDVVHEAFANVRSPGRLEVVHHQPLVVLDGAHNVAGAHALRDALAEEFPSAARTFVVGLLREKDPQEMLEALGATSASRVVCCHPPTARGLDPARLADAAVALGLPPEIVDVVEAVDEAVEHALEVTPIDGQVVVAGSLYVVGAARRTLVHDSEPGEGAN